MNLSIERADVRRLARTLLGCVVSYCAARLASLPELYWAVITTLIVVTQPSLNQALSIGRDQIIGACIGAAFGALGIVAMQHGGAPLLVFAVALVPLALMTALRPSLRLACVTLVIVVLIPASGSPFERPLDRVLEILIGAMAALLAAYVLPNRATRMAHRRAADMLEALSELLVLYLGPHSGEQGGSDDARAQRLEAQCGDAQSALESAMTEAGREHIVLAFRQGKADLIDAIAPLLRRLHRDTAFLARIWGDRAVAIAPEQPVQQVQPELGAVFAETLQALAELVRNTGKPRAEDFGRIDAACRRLTICAGKVMAPAKSAQALPFVIGLLVHDVQELAGMATPH